MSNELLEELDSLFKKHYTKYFEELNSKIYTAEKDETGCFMKPAVEIYGKGGTILPTGTETFELNKPAVVKMKRKKFKPFRLVYRLSLPREEMEIAVKNPEYFRHFMDETLRVAMSNYTATIGTFDKVRFGEVYCTPFRPGPENQVFTELDDHNIELRLYSNFASEEEVK